MLLQIPRPSPKSIFLYVAGFACLVITALMNRHAGVSQGATEEGRQLLGAGAIVIDIVGLVIFGSVAGNLLAAGKRWLGMAVLVVVIGCAIFSISSIMSFIAGEWLSVAESRRAADQAVKEQRAANRAAQELAARERRELQARLAQQHLKTLEGTNLGKGAGRQEKRELRTDMNKAAADLIAKVGQGDAVAQAPEPATSQDIQLRPDGGAEIIAWMTSLPERTVQVTRMAALAILLIVIKAFAFPLGGYFWRGRPESATLVLMPEPTVPEPVKLETPKPLALPKPVEAIPLRAEPSPEWRALLDAIDFPRKKPGLREPKRAQDAREHVLGLRWLIWLMAHDRVGDMTAQEVERLYDEYVAADAREPWGVNIAKAELRTMGKRWVTVRESKSPTMWSIERPKIAHIRDLLLKRQKALVQSGSWKGIAGNDDQADPKPGGNVVRPPFGEAVCGEPQPAPLAANDARAAPRKALQGLAELSRYMPDLDGMRALERRVKHAWQQKSILPHRKQMNRMRRVRAA